MKTFRAMLVRFAGCFRRKQLEVEMNAELQAHLDGLTERNIAAGMTPEEARYAARREFGGVEQIKERARDERRSAWGEQVLQDVRYAVRQLRKTPGFTAVAVLSLALGIGGNTAIFSLVNEVLLKSLPVENPEELIVFRWHWRDRPRGLSGEGHVDPVTKLGGSSSFSFAAFEQFRAQSGVLSAVFAFAPLFSELSAVIDGQAEVIPESQVVSGNYHAGLGVSAILGRTLGPDDDRPEAAPAAVISHRYWQRRFGGDARAVGKTVWLNGVAVTIVGVTPPKFSGALQVGDSPDVSIPLALAPRLRPSSAAHMVDPANWWLRIMGRLPRDVAAEQARTQLEVIFRQTALDAAPTSKQTDLAVRPELRARPHLALEPGGRGLDHARRSYRGSLAILFGLVALVLVIACANIVVLLLARGAARRKEIAMRLALGASRARLIRQLLTESLLLSVLGGGLGVLLAIWAMDVLVALQPLQAYYDRAAFTLEPSIDLHVLAFTAGVAVLTGLLFGLAPALRATRVDLTAEFQGGAGSRGGGGRAPLAHTLMVAQVALSVVLLVGAGLLVRTLQNLRGIDVGFNRERLLVFRIDAISAGRGRAELPGLYEHLSQRIGALPGVRAATFSLQPLFRGGWGVHVAVPGYVPPTGNVEYAQLNGIGPEFFSTFEIPLRDGRAFVARDQAASAAKVAVVNQAFARKYFGAENAVGRHLGWNGRPATVEIVGVARDAKYGHVKGAVPPTIYLPYGAAQAGFINGAAYFAVRTTAEPEAMLPAIRRAVHEIDPNLPLFDVQTGEEQAERQFRRERVFAQLSGFFGALALALVSVGLYGLMTHAVVRRTAEIGVRMALGALPTHVLRMILRESLALVVVGVAIGIATACAASRLIAGMLYQVSPLNPATYGSVAGLLLLVAVIACLLPARRAAKIDPMAALRAE